MTYLAIILAAFFNGSRTFAAPALVAWAAAFGWLDIGGTALSFVGAPAPAALLTLVALGELYGDKQPDAPNRTIWFGLLARIVMGALTGAVIALGAAEPLNGWLGAGLGAIAAAVGTYITLRFRLSLAKRMGRDLPAALIEDILVIGAVALAILLAA